MTSRVTVRFALVSLLVLLAVVELTYLCIQVQELRPLRQQPLLLETVSEISGSVDVNLNQLSELMTFQTTVENKNGISNTITTTVADYDTPDLAHAAHVEAINRWIADDTAGA